MKVSTVTNSHLISRKSIIDPLQEDPQDRKLPNLCKSICGKCSHWLDRIPWLLSSGITVSCYWMHHQPLGPSSWTELMSLAGDKWSDCIFSLGSVTLMDTFNFSKPRIHLFASWVHSRLLNLRLTGSASGTNCAHNNKLNFH